MKKNMCAFSIFILINCNVFPQELIPFSYNGRYGYINSEFNIVIEPRFINAEHFSTDGFAIVSFGSSNPGIIDINGNVIKSLDHGLINYIYGDLFYFYDFGETNDTYIIRIKDNKIIARQTGYPGKLSEKGYMLASFSYDERRFVFIDFDGNKVLTHLNMTRLSYSFFEQRASISFEDWVHQIIDMEGNVVGNIKFSYLGQRYSEGLIPAKSLEGGVTGYVNRSGSFAFTVPFLTEGIPMATNFRGGYAAIKTNASPSIWKIINAQGRIVSDNIFVSNMQDFSDGLSLVSIFDPTTREHKYGYINTRGEYLVRPVLENADSFENGYARIVYNGKEGLLKTNGRVIWSSDIIRGSSVENELR
jgi:hypothetical protein